MKTPQAFSKYGYATGDNGLARLELSEVADKTLISKLLTSAPLLVQKALYPDTRFPGMAHIYLMSSAGGILQGDRIEIDLGAGRRTTSRVTTQAATKIYRMNKGYATQHVKISLSDASYLEFVPHQIIPFGSSRFFQQTDINLGQNSTLVYSETVSAGRIASGESFDFDICFLKVSALDSGGELLFAESAKLEPAKADLEELFGCKTIWSTIYIITREFDEIIKEINSAIKDRLTLAGCSTLPHDCGIIVRVLDDSIDRIRNFIDLLSRITRNEALSIRANS